MSSTWAQESEAQEAPPGGDALKERLAAGRRSGVNWGVNWGKPLELFVLSKVGS